jgi:NhaA family Na+:H+ antiporter
VTKRNRYVKRILAPVERFLAIEASSGIVLTITAALALGWANSRWHDFYERLWQFPIGITLTTFQFERDLHFWINDGVMTIFFFVVGLEIRREIQQGELHEIRRAALPLAAAAGGMIVPGAIFALLNSGRSSSVGWAIPMATDIAFAVGILAFLGRRVTPALRIFLLALAVIDDVGAILVIALFYSTQLAAAGFVILGLGVLSIFSLRHFAIRVPLMYVITGIIVWAGAYIAGIHPTLAGVVMGLMTPANVEKLQRSLHGWVAYALLPLFAFANAGVRIGTVSLSGDALWVFVGIAVGLVIGKPLGIVIASWMAVRSGAAVKPRGMGWSAVSVAGMAGGIGFTMALFIAQLAFPSGTFLETAKLGILCGSSFAGVLSLAVGYQTLTMDRLYGGASTDAEAETSTLL